MTDKYAVIGNPIGHTKSPLIHGLFAKETKQDMNYTAIEGPLEPENAFEDTVRAFAAGGERASTSRPLSSSRHSQWPTSEVSVQRWLGRQTR